MSPEWILVYGAAFFVQVVVPGPATIFVVGTALARGQGAAMSAGIGLAAGDVLLAAIALAGLSAAAVAYPQWWTALEMVGACYLIILAFRLWNAPPRASAEARRAGPAGQVAAGGLLALTNPRGIAAHASLMPLAMKGIAVVSIGAAAILVLVFAINLAVLGAYALASARVGRSARATRWVGTFNAVAAVAMIASAAAIVIF